MDRETAEPTVDQHSDEASEAWIAAHQDVAAPSEYSHEFVWDVTGDAEGPFVTDLDGNVLMDFTCHIGAAPLGYNNPKILDKLREFDLVDPLKIAGQDFYSGSGTVDDPEFPGSTQLMQELTERSSQYGMDTVFLSNSGAEAIENAMKMAYDYCDAPKYGITFTGAFHGRTFGALSVTRAKSVYTRKFPELAGIREVPFCACEGDCTCGFWTGGQSRLETLLGSGGHVDPNEVAFLVMEPIQGVGGYRFPSDEFAREVGRVSETYDIPLIVDEIQTGIGRSGSMWASDYYSFEPDIIAAGKALRVGATVSRSELFPDEKNRLGSTWGGGDVVASMQGAFTLEAIDEHDLLSNAENRGTQLVESLDTHHDCVEDTRNLGLLAAVDYDTKERRDAVVAAALDRGLLTLGCGTRTLRLLPPLDVTGREVDLGTSLLNDAVAEVADD
ncbi:aspartate aminotransferase family protein [Halolamina sp.]|jgi:4-aminobutyrate aminotransferase|uniref:class-III pyridoxal-phosphate-dependent aminotransferase n=1 Tax=Halolamina sp. TaxID=1940283 RepID=UPI000223B76E|nr:Acetylornithine transaminase [halophilic archaeon DL31]